jgi:hypothetical protein
MKNNYKEIDGWCGHDYHIGNMKDAFDILKIDLYSVIHSSINYLDSDIWRGTSWWYNK